MRKHEIFCGWISYPAIKLKHGSKQKAVKDVVVVSVVAEEAVSGGKLSTNTVRMEMKSKPDWSTVKPQDGTPDWPLTRLQAEANRK
jgi:hypothetical protein